MEIKLKRGVKQGDLISPLKFNLVIEPIIEKVELEKKRNESERNRVAILAFADDLVLIGKDSFKAQKRIKTVSKALQGLGMSLAASKCQAFEIIPGGKSWYTKEPQIAIDGEIVPFLKSQETFRYLGAKISSWKGVIKGIETSSIIKVVRNVRKIKLKPHQKISLLKTYIMPKFIYPLSVNTPSKGTLRTMERELRQEIKEILHLPSCTAMGFDYASCSD